MQDTVDKFKCKITPALVRLQVQKFYVSGITLSCLTSHTLT